MDINAQDALILLRKWKEESRAIHYFVKLPERNVQSLGRIIQASEAQLTISLEGTNVVSLGENFTLSLSLSGAEYDYVEGRHASARYVKVQAYDAMLTITYRNTQTVVGIGVLPPAEELMHK